MTIIVALMLAAPAHGVGIVSHLCRLYLSKIVMDDPYQFEHLPIECLEIEIAQLSIKYRWGKLDDAGTVRLRMMLAEVRHRRRLARWTSKQSA